MELALILIDARPQVVRINYLPLRDRSIILVNIPSSHGDQGGGEEQQEEDCAASGSKSPGSCELSVNYLGDDDETSSGKSVSKNSVDCKEKVLKFRSSLVLLTNLEVFITDDLWVILPLPHCEADLLVCQSSLYGGKYVLSSKIYIPFTCWKRTRWLANF